MNKRIVCEEVSILVKCCRQTCIGVDLTAKWVPNCPSYKEAHMVVSTSLQRPAAQLVALLFAHTFPLESLKAFTEAKKCSRYQLFVLYR